MQRSGLLTTSSQNMDLNIKNYTSTVAVSQTIARIEAKLAAAGASEIVKIYGPDQSVWALRFKLNFEGRIFTVQLPADADACFQTMWRQHNLKSRRVHSSAKARIKDQALRTAWKLVQDWVDVQISLIVMKQAEWLQVFMAYLYDGNSGQTYYQLTKSGGFKQLPWHSDQGLNSGDLADAMMGGNGPIPRA